MAYATTLNNTAMTYRYMQKYEEAKACLTAARKLFENHGETQHPLYASVLNTLALTYMDEGKKGDGIELLEKSLEIINSQTAQ